MPETKPSHTARRKPIQGKVRWITVHTSSGRAVHIPIPARGGHEPRKLHGAQVAAGQWAAKHNVAAKEGGKPEPKPEPKPKKEPKPKPQPKPKKEVESKIRQAKEHAAKKKVAAEKKVNDAKEREAKKKVREEAAKKKVEETATKKKAREEAAKKRADEAVARKKAKEETTKKKAEETAAKKKTREEAAKKRADEAVARKKVREEAAKKKSEPKPETKPKKKVEDKTKETEKKPEPASESNKHIQDYLKQQRGELKSSAKRSEFRFKYGDNLTEYEGLAEKTPGLIPDGPIHERIDVYLKAHGHAKIDRMESELSKLEKEHQSTMQDLYARHGQLQQRLAGGDEAAVEAHRESVHKIAAEREKYASKQRERVAEILKVENPTTIHSFEHEDYPVHDAAINTYHNKSREFLGPILHDNGESDNFVRIGRTPDKYDQRDYYDQVNNTVMSSKGSDTSISTHVHELGHWIDNRIKLNGSRVLRGSLRFLQMRTKGEQAKEINEVTHSKAYRNGERGWEDDFSKVFGEKGVYVGKDYHGDGAEIVSMGVQQLYDDPISMTKDRQYLGFILGVLDGRLR